jgi:serine/threonine-protein kinase HipA
VSRPGGALPAFFTGLLPEGRRLSALRRLVKTSADDELSLLLAVGADAIGDVQVVPGGQLPQQVGARVEVAGFGEVRFRALLADQGMQAERTALPGVQDKVSAAMINVPVSRRGARFLLKLTPPEFPHLVANEFCFLTAGRLAGLTMSSAELVQDAEGVPGLLVRRFDRVPQAEGQRPLSLAVEDACQVLGLPPADKYRVSAERALGALASLCQSPLAAGRTLLMQAVFAYLTGNGDAHAKNFSVLQGSDGEWAPTPAYDVPSSQPYGDSTLGLSVNSRTADPGGRDFMVLGRALGLPDRASGRVIAAQVDRVDSWLPLVDTLPFDLATRRKLVRVVRHRRTRLAAAT